MRVESGLQTGNRTEKSVLGAEVAIGRQQARSGSSPPGESYARLLFQRLGVKLYGFRKPAWPS